MELLVQGDCVEKMQHIKDGRIDLVITSPPYDDLRKYNDSSSWGFDKFKDVANELYRVVKDGGIVVWIVSDKTVKGSETLSSFKQALYFKEIGFNMFDTMIWRKPNPSVPTQDRYYNAFEYMFILSKGKPTTLNLIEDKPNKGFGKTYVSDTKMNPEKREKNGNVKTVKEFSRRHNVWDIPIGSNKTKHPAVFPLQLAIDHIISWSNEGDTVLDPFMGSGTTGVACKKLNRDFVGMEIDAEYFDIARNRIFDEKGEN